MTAEAVVAQREQTSWILASAEEMVVIVVRKARRTAAPWAPRIVGWMTAVTMFVATCVVVATFGAASSHADVGELGPPPNDSDVKAALTDLYSAGHPPDYTTDVEFVGPILVGPSTVHPNPPPQPWCVRCGYPDQGASPMYPVLAVVKVSTTQGLASSALPAGSVMHTTTTTYNGTPCPGQTVAQYCPSYFFYRDRSGNWQIA